MNITELLNQMKKADEPRKEEERRKELRISKPRTSTLTNKQKYIRSIIKGRCRR